MITTNSANIALIKNYKNVGDCAQIDGVADSVSKYFIQNSAQLNTTEVDINNLSNPVHNSIVILAGLCGLNLLSAHSNQIDENSMIVCLTHQWYEEIESLIKHTQNHYGLDIIAIPSHALHQGIRNLFSDSYTTLVITNGVCHNVSSKDIIREYNLFKDLFPFDDNNKLIAIVLPGDSLNPDNTWLFFTAEEAERIANHMVSYLNSPENQNSNLIVTNGPRTGKHNPATGEENFDAHRNGSLDSVTARFMGIIGNSVRNLLFDFQYGVKGQFMATLGALQKSSRSELYLPGESTSMISEAVDTLSGDNGDRSITIIMHSAMNESHSTFVQALQEKNIISILTKDNQLIAARKDLDTSENEPYVSARDMVAQSICTKYFGSHQNVNK